MPYLDDRQGQQHGKPNEENAVSVRSVDGFQVSNCFNIQAFFEEIETEYYFPLLYLFWVNQISSLLNHLFWTPTPEIHHVLFFKR